MNIFLDANICLDLLDTTRQTSKKSVEWYMAKKDDENIEFYFSGDFITTIFYILTQRKKYNPREALKVLDLMIGEITPIFINYNDYIIAKNKLFDEYFNDLEDLIILNGAKRLKCEKFITNDKNLLKLSNYHDMKIVSLL